MKNVKSLKVNADEVAKLTRFQRHLLGLWQLRINWVDNFGFDYNSFVIDYEYDTGDLKMTVGDWLEVRFYGGMYYVIRNFENGKWHRVGQFDEDSIDLIADDYLNGKKEFNYMLDGLDEDVHGLDFDKESDDLEDLIFTFGEIGHFEKRIEGRSYKQGGGNADMHNMFRDFAK